MVSSHGISLLQQHLMIAVHCRKFRICATEQEHLILVELSSDAWGTVACMIDVPLCDV